MPPGDLRLRYASRAQCREVPESCQRCTARNRVGRRRSRYSTHQVKYSHGEGRQGLVNDSARGRSEKDALLTALQRNWRTEMEGAATYRYLATRETDPTRKRILFQLAEGEAKHAERWGERLRALGADVPSDRPPHVSWITGVLAPEVALMRLESEE